MIILNYRECVEKSKKYKEKYRLSIDSFIEKHQTECEKQRKEFTDGIFDRQDEYRRNFFDMLGYPLNLNIDKLSKNAEYEKLSDEGTYEVYRLHIDVIDDIRLTGLFFKKKDKKYPLIIAQHGLLGSPEAASGFYGDTSNYHDMITRLFKYDVHIFAPQLLLWNADFYKVDYDRILLDSRLKSVGSSITALEVYGLIRSIDYFETLDYVSGFGMIGLSYGGFYSLFTAAADTRIKATLSCSFFNDSSKRPMADWLWQNSAKFFTDSEVACLIYPRKLYIKVGSRDPLFKSKNSVFENERLKVLCKNVGTHWYNYEVFDGVHEFFCSDSDMNAIISELN